MNPVFLPNPLNRLDVLISYKKINFDKSCNVAIFNLLDSKYFNLLNIDHIDKAENKLKIWIKDIIFIKDVIYSMKLWMKLYKNENRKYILVQTLIYGLQCITHRILDIAIKNCLKNDRNIVLAEDIYYAISHI